MKLSKKQLVEKNQLVEMILNEVLTSLSSKIREMVANEIDIERKRVRKQLLEEFRDRLKKPLTESARHAQQPAHFPAQKKRIDTGDRMINNILEDVESDMETMVPEFKFEAEHTVRDVVNETTKRPSPSAAGLWKPSEGEAYNFDPLKMDPTQIDWSNMVDALEARSSALPGDQK
jgi:hypothetical protein